MFIQGTNQPIYITTIAFVFLSLMMGTKRSEIIVLIWLGVLFISAFLINPINIPDRELISGIRVIDGQIQAQKTRVFDSVSIFIFCSLCFMPLIALSAHKKAIYGMIAVIAVFAAGLIYQYFWDPELMYNHKRAAFPMGNPNNAASVVNMALVPVVCMFIKNRKLYYLPLIAILSGGLICTLSKGGIIAASVAVSLYIALSYRDYIKAFIFMIPGFIIAGSYVGFEKMLGSLMDRVPVWEGSLQLLSWKGSGIGTFYERYPKVRMETDTDGFFAHNDLLHFTIEFGIPGAIVFCLLIGWVVKNTSKDNLIPAVAMFAIFLQSIISYPFYVVPVNIGMGILLANWLENRRKKCQEL